MIKHFFHGEGQKLWGNKWWRVVKDWSSRVIWWVNLNFGLDVHVIHTLDCTHTVSVQSQPIINVREGQNSEDRVREPSAVFVACL